MQYYELNIQSWLHENWPIITAGELSFTSVFLIPPKILHVTKFGQVIEYYYVIYLCRR